MIYFRVKSAHINQLQFIRWNINVYFSRNLIEIIYSIMSLDSVVTIATGYALDYRGVGVRFPVRSRIFNSPCHADRLCTYDIELIGVNAAKPVETVGENLVSIYRDTTSQILRATFMLLGLLFGLEGRGSRFHRIIGELTLDCWNHIHDN